MQVYLTSKTVDLEIYCGVPKGWSNVELMALYEALGGKYPYGVLSCKEETNNDWQVPEGIKAKALVKAKAKATAKAKVKLFEYSNHRHNLEEIANGIKAGDEACIEIAIRYIELNYFARDSGYVKAQYARLLRSQNLSIAQISRLQKHFAQLIKNKQCFQEFSDYKRLIKKLRLMLIRLFEVQLKEELSFLQENGLSEVKIVKANKKILGDVEEVKKLILALLIECVFLQESVPSSPIEFDTCLEKGRNRLTPVFNEIKTIVVEIFQAAQEVISRLKTYQIDSQVFEDIESQLARLLIKDFILEQPYKQLKHFPRYLKAMVIRLDKLKANRVRDQLKMSEVQPLEQNFWRLVQERKGKLDPRVHEMRWLLEELRVSLFAQELRSPQAVSIKRLEQVWAQLML
jgi:hypothetical protein